MRRLDAIVTMMILLSSVAGWTEPVSVSGIYLHLTVFNSSQSRDKPEPECGLGMVVPWAGKLWSHTYTSHALGKGPDKLFSIAPDLSLDIRPESVGGTHACRMIHRESEQLFIGCYAIDAVGNVRVIDRAQLPGRLTAIARHLTEPAGKVIYLTQEGAVYEVAVDSLEVRELFKKPLPGWHYKGAWTAQGRLFIAANGEEPAPSPFWKVDYSSAATKQLTEIHAAQFYQVPAPERAPARETGQTMWKGRSEDMGSLGEWDGTQWKVIERRQHLDITGPGGLRGAHGDDEPVWALGWDLRSAFVKVRDVSGRWSRYRLPKASYSADGDHGSNTEWPRICEIGQGRRLMFLHNGLFEFPGGFREGQTGGLRQIASSLATVTDMTTWEGRLVFSQQATSVHGIPDLVPGQPNSNLQFLRVEDLPGWGPAAGFGGVWVADSVNTGTPSDPFLIGGYAERCLHLVNHSDAAVRFALETDVDGSGTWSEQQQIEVPGGGYSHVIMPDDLNAQWLRITADVNCVATAYLHVRTPRPSEPGEEKIAAGLADAGAQNAIRGIVRQGFPTRNLQFLASDGSYYEVGEELRFELTKDPEAIEVLRKTHEIQTGFAEDDASVIVTRYDGRRFRLPKGDAAFSKSAASRTIRECIQERYLAHVHGTLYEVPRGGTAPNGQRNQPDWQRMKPVTTHNRAIVDFCTWRGLLVLSGVRKDAAPSPHVFGDSEARLWFGAIDDLWKFGKPRGSGGPWIQTPVKAGQSSDPYLMAGYDQKFLTLSHDSADAVDVLVEVDFYASGQWHEYERLRVEPGELLAHAFPRGFSAHWVRLTAGADCTVTALFDYQ